MKQAEKVMAEFEARTKHQEALNKAAREGKTTEKLKELELEQLKLQNKHLNAWHNAQNMALASVRLEVGLVVVLVVLWYILFISVCNKVLVLFPSL